MARKAIRRDENGRESTVYLPDGAPDSMIGLGTVIGPPPLDELDLPPEIVTAIHNQLNARGILTFEDLKKHRQEATLAVQAAFRMSVNKLEVIYQRWGQVDP